MILMDICCYLLQASAGAAELAAAQARTAGQLQAMESQLASKDAALEASQVRLAALEAELKSAHSKVGQVPNCCMLSDVSCADLGSAQDRLEGAHAGGVPALSLGEPNTVWNC